MVILFYIILVLIPVNLGKHFIFDFSYSEGILIDYAVPTLYLQDLLIILFLALYILANRTLPKKVIYVLPLVFLLLLNSAFSTNVLASLYFASRIIIYTFFSLVGWKYAKKISSTSLLLGGCLSLSLLGALSIAQWYLQSSVFNNYLFFGEQPYSLLTSGILHHMFLGDAVIPPYAVFKHPNILGGYLSIVLIWLSSWLFFSQKKSMWLHALVFTSLLLGTLILFLTFSYSAWVSLSVGYVFLFLSIYKPQIARMLMPLSVLLIFTLGMFGFFTSYRANQSTSLARRLTLIQSSVHLFKLHPFVGTGLNTNAFLNKDTPYFVREVNFYQPVHNIYWLLLSEGGLILFIPFVLVLLFIYMKSLKEKIFVSVSLSQFMLLGVFDHYLLTSHQLLLLVLLTLIVSLNYTFKHEI